MLLAVLEGLVIGFAIWGALLVAWMIRRMTRKNTEEGTGPNELDSSRREGSG